MPGMRTSGSLLVSSLVCALVGGLAVGCRADSESFDPPGAGPSESAAVHVHSDDHHHGEHVSPAALRRTLLTANDLPDGYVAGAGHHHAVATGSAPPVPEECSPLAEVLGDHPAVQQTVHPQATASFSKSHFGPTVTEIVIDFGDREQAAAALARLERAARECTEYVQAVDAPGANAYRVLRETSVEGLPDGARASLEASGADFAGISWEIWASSVGSRLVGVSLRTARGGKPTDLPAVVLAAVERARSVRDD